VRATLCEILAANFGKQHSETSGWISFVADLYNKLINLGQQIDEHVSCEELSKRHTI
jgi:hypothetical protein